MIYTYTSDVDEEDGWRDDIMFAFASLMFICAFVNNLDRWDNIFIFVVLKSIQQPNNILVTI